MIATTEPCVKVVSNANIGGAIIGYLATGTEDAPESVEVVSAIAADLFGDFQRTEAPANAAERCLVHARERWPELMSKRRAADDAERRTRPNPRTQERTMPHIGYVIDPTGRVFAQTMNADQTGLQIESDDTIYPGDLLACANLEPIADDDPRIDPADRLSLQPAIDEARARRLMAAGYEPDAIVPDDFHEHATELSQ